jgi:hypothetical protein
MSEAPDRSRSWESTPACRQLRAARGLRFRCGGFVQVVDMCGEQTEHSSGRRGFALGPVPAVMVSAALSTASFSAGNEGPLDWGQLHVYLLFGGVGVVAGLVSGWATTRNRVGLPLPVSLFAAIAASFVGRGLRSSCSLRLVATGLSRLLKRGMRSASSLSLSDRGYAARPITKGNMAEAGPLRVSARNGEADRLSKLRASRNSGAGC